MQFQEIIPPRVLENFLQLQSHDLMVFEYLKVMISKRMVICENQKGTARRGQQKKIWLDAVNILLAEPVLVVNPARTTWR